MKNLLKLSLIISATTLIGCGSEEGNDSYGFVTTANEPVEMDSHTKTVTIDVNGLNGEEIVLVNLLDGMSIDGQAIDAASRDVFIKGLSDPQFQPETLPALVGQEIAFFDFDAVNEETAAEAGSDEQLKSVKIQPVQIEENTLILNRHLFSQAKKATYVAKDDKTELVEPIQRLSQVTYTLSYTVDNGYPCVSLDSTYHLGQCTQFLLDQGNSELCHSSGDSVETCGQYLLDNGTEHTFECADVENCTSAETSTNLKTVLRNAVMNKIQDADGNLPNVRTLTLVVNNNTEAEGL